jgi:hypothetical protein
LAKAVSILTLVMSAPLFLSFQLKTPPEALTGLPFILLWTWGIIAAITLPPLGIANVVLLLRNVLLQNASKDVGWQVAAVVVFVAAEIVFLTAR